MDVVFFFWCMPSQHSVVQIHHNRHVLFIVRATVSHINSVSFVDFYLFSAVLHHTAHVQFCCLSSRLGDRASARQTYGDGRQPTKTESERRNCAQHNIAIYLFEALIARTAHNGKSNGETKKGCITLQFFIRSMHLHIAFGCGSKKNCNQRNQSRHLDNIDLIDRVCCVGVAEPFHSVLCILWSIGATMKKMHVK